MRLAPMFTGLNLQQQQRASLSPHTHFASNSIAVKQPLNSDVVTLSHQPRFGAFNVLHNAVMQSNGDPSNANFRAALRSASRETLNEQDEDGETPLHTAATQNFHLIVRALLSKQGIDSSIQNYEGYTAKGMAEALENHKVVEEFTRKGL